ncbi:hypothetical protein Z517_07609 [Fonsecaea pedrosoi CBS 271.37]|uniref:Cyclase n=1 Tax=Fonsecaea pedrosoi CBS 271.37 TaxID=1442368 RepID=A0A0D2DJC8_9EURO|nr:uncharacterized protein Z517_07609 [Fonsecaea pedrosoi CBS 271.37]KIW77776.1 hypothetical protein Z517_07609 [Fonsecaea pedrosoi CBS 271.37]
MAAINYPPYDSLPLRGGKRSAWAIWNRDGVPDHLGALNHLDSEARCAAAREVVHGESFQLDWAYDEIGKPAFGRQGLTHNVIDYHKVTGEMAHDDVITFNTQCGSQWDGFMHYADQNLASYYNGVKHGQNTIQDPASHSIHYWCKKGIVGRGVLLDWPRWLESTGKEPFSPISSRGLSVQDMKLIAEHQGVQFSHGDILIIRTGFLKWYREAPEQARSDAFDALRFAGVQQGTETQRWLWDSRFAAVAGDAVSWECYPPPSDGSMLHQWLLPHVGIPIGELWDLESLGEACHRLKKWTFMLCSAPLNIPGGIASPPNVVAIL